MPQEILGAKHHISKCELFYSISFCYVGYINIFLSVLWILRIDEAEIISTGIAYACYFLFLILSVYRFISMRERFPRKIYLFTGIMFAIFMYPFAEALFLQSNDKLVITMSAKFIVFSLPMFFLGLCISSDNDNQHFIKWFKWIGVSLVPICLYYVFQMIFLTNGEVECTYNLGQINYQSIGYLLSSVIMGTMLELFSGGSDHVKLNYLIIVFLWAVLIYAGARGAILCVICCIALSICFRCLIRGKRLSKEIVIIALLLITVYLVSVNIWMPEGSRWVSNNFTKFIPEISEVTDTERADGSHEVKHGSENSESVPPKEMLNSASDVNVAGKSEDEIKEQCQNDYIRYIVDSDQSLQESIEDIHDDISNEKYEIIKDGSSFSEKEKEYYVNYQLNVGRIQIYKMAVEETLKHPLMGNGFLYFKCKFGDGFWPHNFFLELACDKGIPFTILIAVILIYMLVKTVSEAKKDTGFAYIMIMILSNASSYLVSGSAYLAKYVVMFIGMWIAHFHFKGSANNLRDGSIISER